MASMTQRVLFTVTQPKSGFATVEETHQEGEYDSYRCQEDYNALLNKLTLKDNQLKRYGKDILIHRITS